eukprot:NODE_702_length_1399_cov_598.770089.p2 GENE.NODE_702_length_1399_cov_598.770089~~NODE_702_length_1399_cov_598.770089.p2  ORF type:complete len:315 (-),score=100.10 NODE_702_length_1399_cov_598.770089:344-1288(-)
MDLVENFDESEQRFDSKYEIFDKIPLLGEGTYGKVYQARHRNTGELVAMKEMKLESQEEGVPSTAIREIALLKELSHTNVVRLLDVFCKPDKLVLVFEFLENDLKKYMKGLGGCLSPPVVKNFAQQLCRAVDFCHANRILHRDIKPQNLLIDTHERLKLADFGLARAFTVPVPKYTHEVVTVWYRAPEILLSEPLYSLAVDAWSIGCVLGEMATSLPLFGGDSEIGTIFKIFQKLGTPTEAVWPGVSELRGYKASFPKWPKKSWSTIRNTAIQLGPDGIDLLECLLCYDPRKRISARRALVHKYISDAEGSTVK